MAEGKKAHPTLESSTWVGLPDVAGVAPRQVLYSLFRDKDIKDFCRWALTTLPRYEANGVTGCLGETSESMYR